MKNIEQARESIESDKRKLTIIFDIHNTLAAHTSIEAEDRLYLLRKSMIIFAGGREHQVFPGVVELMQFIFSKDFINVAFFSSGTKARNTEFVKQLLIRSLGKDKYLTIESSINILSKEDLSPKDETQGRKMYQNFGLNSRNNKKDITKALTRGGSLIQTIFVDDDLTHIYYGQEKNFVQSPRGIATHYSRLTPDIGGREERTNISSFEYNTVFYIAGVLSQCIDEFEKGNDVRGLLFNMHFKKTEDRLFRYEPRYDCMKSKEYYIKGLTALRSVNPSICFVSHEDYIETLDLPAKSPEQ